ncbi:MULTISPECIES: hemin uptake protein HemP [Paraburkholderia]|uniref:Hemin uptake protein HemP n=1 Tax=Paraburkholderia tropica TaxID=92647 RepID=A0AAQ1JWZ2_9BURK|nr:MULTISPECIES: hemin uptake protein HemP [Paraburkholderia]MBB2999970.1 hemin uptake protein HemP [Paraburkholderia tropica]MBB6319600.1 hemin uptake protein HemP [Paraburkholderia tropica]QNB11788.1 hemin uptake protein HemP [Paraburkholderia tropica]RQM49351.1 hemin uptake protein HemP [Paraburkholderia bannensis]RQN40771.1 hemin uptake protein HemP [Paraburkholderia tropica]
MTEFNRSSTLSLRRNGSALTGSRPAKPVTAAAARKSADTASTAAPASSERTLDSTALLQGRSHVSILHNGETYQLRATRLGKLILTK